MKIFSVVVAFQWSKGNFCLLEIEKNQDIIRYDDINYLYLRYVSSRVERIVGRDEIHHVLSGPRIYDVSVNRIFGGHHRLCLRSRFERIKQTRKSLETLC